jgi:hypothetical protein
MTTAGTTQSSGPAFELKVKPVQIVFIEEAIEIGSDGEPTAIGVAAVHDHIGGPDALGRTDVVVFNGQPWHMVDGTPKSHPKVHIDFPDTILNLSVTGGERACWWSQQDFTIDSIALSRDHVHGGAAVSTASAASSM